MTYLFLWHRRGTYKTLRYTTSEHWTSFTFTQFIIIFFICKAEALCFTYLICLDQKYLNIEEINSKWSHIIFYMGSCCNMPGFLFGTYCGEVGGTDSEEDCLFPLWSLIKNQKILLRIITKFRDIAKVRWGLVILRSA